MKNILAHHGIAGQRWGQRNGPPYPIAPSAHSKSEEKANWRYSLNRNTNSDTTLKQIAERSRQSGKLSLFKHKPGNATKSKASHKTTSPLHERIMSPFKKSGLMATTGIDSKDIKLLKLGTLRPMNDDGIRIKKGEWVQRVISTPTQDLTGRDTLFVSATEADKKNYAGFFAALTKYRNNADKMYKMDMKAVNDIVSPSKKERVETFIKLYKDDPIGMSTRLAEFNKKWYGGQYKESTEQLIKKYSKMSMHKLKGEGYYIFANSWFDPSAGTLKMYREELEKKGYNATIDDNDKRSFIQAQAPLIVFDVMKNFGDIKYSNLTTGEIRRNMIDWQNMKHGSEDKNMTYEEYLIHHGILGMHWGVRRYQNKDGSLTAVGRKRLERKSSNSSADYERYKELKKRNKKSLSNDELRELAERKELEYRAKGKTRAQEAADEELARFGMKALTTALVAGAAIAGGLYLKKKFNITLESVVRKGTELSARATGAAAKETAKQLGDALRESIESGKFQKTVNSAVQVSSKAVGEVAKAAAPKLGEAGAAIAKGAVSAVKKAAPQAGAAIVKTAKEVAPQLGSAIGEAAKRAAPSVGKALRSAGDTALSSIGKAQVDAGKAVAGGAVSLGRSVLRKFGVNT